MAAIAASLLVGTALLLLAEVRHWRPRLTVSLAVAFALQLAVGIASARSAWQPWDFITDFPRAAQDFLAHRDPVLNARTYGWNYLPLNAILLGGQFKIGSWLGLSWTSAGRTVPIISNLILVGLVGKLARRDGRLRSFQYACSPMAILVAADHGQLEPTTLVFAVSAFLIARRDRALLAGTALGFAVASKTWPVVLLPALWLSLPSLRARVQATAGLAVTVFLWFITMPLTVGTPWGKLLDSAHLMARYRIQAGEWGWSAVVNAVVGNARTTQINSAWGPVATVATVVLILLALALYRHADDNVLVIVTMTIFLVTASRFGAQYLMWPLPWVIAHGYRRGQFAWLVAAGWAAIGYLALTTLRDSAWSVWHGRWAVGSLVVIVAMLAALPLAPRRSRVAQPEAYDRQRVFAVPPA